MRIFKTAIAALFATLIAAPAFADKFVGYGAVEGWNVYVDTEKKSCMIETKDDLDNVVQMGLTEERDVAYIGIFTKDKTDIQRGFKKEVAILLGENVYLGEATGMRGNITKGYSGGYVLTDNPQVIEDIAKERVMVVFPEEEFSFIVNLDGTYKALELARECTQAQMN
ncbi:hypothetical protein [Shimia haliotis]|uniref:Invasion protein IalB, involved in pathogenesis n=1 Tax=Shimia haliotis TaxID=1280847 RepID=A0A1I4F8D9_9RHOB|nr:hypothetical protein [Shimia haliotis]SFL14164.1 hypothetical protein SAMN04488036_105282 [Shimia haliotis]